MVTKAATSAAGRSSHDPTSRFEPADTQDEAMGWPRARRARARLTSAIARTHSMMGPTARFSRWWIPMSERSSTPISMHAARSSSTFRSDWRHLPSGVAALHACTRTARRCWIAPTSRQSTVPSTSASTNAASSPPASDVPITSSQYSCARASRSAWSSPWRCFRSSDSRADLGAARTAPPVAECGPSPIVGVDATKPLPSSGLSFDHDVTWTSGAAASASS